MLASGWLSLTSFLCMPTILVRVRKDQRGEYGVAGSEPDPNHKTGVAGYTNIIRNAGEVFEMDLRACRPAGATGTGMCEIIKRKIDGRFVEFALPSWVESAGKKKDVEPDELVPAGHLGRHDKDTVI